MLPTAIKTEILPALIETRYPNFTYKMQIEEEMIAGDTDDVIAVWQACYKILNTERYKYPIYSWGYGVELADLFGKPIPYVYSELPRRITEALMYDDRVQSVTNFHLSHKKNDVLAIFKVSTVAGVLEFSKEVTISSV